MSEEAGGAIESSFMAFDLPETELPINYSIPFEWGSLKVTDAAQEAYQLTPLKPGVHKGDLLEEGNRSGKAVNIRLLAPSEILDIPALSENGQILIHGRPTRRGLDLNAGFRRTRSENVEQFTGMVQEFQDLMGLSEGELEEIVSESEEGLSITDFLERQAPQMMVHILSSAVGVMVEKVYSTEQRVESESRLLRRVTVKGLGGIVLGAAAIAFGGPDITTEAIAGVYAGGGVLWARNDIKDYFKISPIREHFIDTTSELFASTVEKDVHDTYCTAHFDHQFEQRLEDS